MTRRIPVVDFPSNDAENLVHLGKKLGKNKLRRSLFNVVYGRGQKPRTKKEIMKVGGIPDKKAQQVQNQLNYLATNYLIVCSKRDRKGTDGHANMYERDETVRANRPKIVYYADHPTAAKGVSTKRRPQISAQTRLRHITKPVLRSKKPVTVLYLYANPDRNNPLRVDLEAARVKEEIRGSRYRNNVKIELQPAANQKALVNGLNDHEPQIVHFSGHGNSQGVATDSRKLSGTKIGNLSFDMLGKALSAVDSPPQIVVLNSCESSGAKKHILPHVKALITMRVSISDVAATIFAAQFYSAIASGQSVKSAFAQGCNAIESALISEKDTPELHVQTGLSADKVKLT